LEWVKPRLYGSALAEDRRTAQWVAVTVLEGTLRLLHPFMPFITEEIWQQLPHQGTSIMVAEWPQTQSKRRDRRAEGLVGHLCDIIAAVRNLRAEMGVPPARLVPLMLRIENDKLLRQIEENGDLLNLAKVDDVVMGPEVEKPRACATAVVKDVEIFMPLEGLIDLKAELKRLQKEAQRISSLLEAIRKKLSNEQFVRKAPREVVARERSKEEELSQQLAKLEQNMRMLSA
jgi:valyl-tRNA synthetase